MATGLAEQLEALHIDRDDGRRAESSQESLHRRTRLLSREISKLLDSLYEIQELRHNGTDTDRLNALVSAADGAVPSLPGQLEDIKKDVDERTSEQLKANLESACNDMEELSRQYRDMKRELQEDAWMVRFESTVNQAESMLGSLDASLMECLRYVEMIASSPVPVTFTSDLPELPSYDKLDILVQKHDQMKQAYAPSLGKILRMMEKSLKERATHNGVMVRRFDDVDKRWRDLQGRFQQLGSRLRRLRSQEAAASNEMEVLVSPTTAPGSYFAAAKPPASHRSSFSSEASRSSPNPSPGIGLAPAPAPLRRKSSFMSATSSSTARTAERVVSSTFQTPAKGRVPSINRVASPTSGSASVSSRSRIPVASPIPRLSLSKSRSNSEGQEELLTPSRPRPGGGYSAMTVPRASLTPSLPRPSTGLRPRGPPSAYRSMTPTPGARPSSRLSMVSHAPSAAAPVNLQPFQPSPYDLLDKHVQAVIDDVGFNLFVARVDQAMKRGQRRGENEEWKGEFVFGAGQRTSGVKLLKLAGKPGADGPRMKCLVRVQGAWHDLATVLRKRQAEIS